ncbi:MAG: hypothetical protein OXC95_15490, partial [Dehalococcoidia bacterium]|nr:hypothetical protein [Dehalococcoidia bacterium]
MNSSTAPKAYTDTEDNIVVQASAALSCRRALWYDLTGHQHSNPPDEKALMRMSMSGALAGLVTDRMAADGWRLTTMPPDGMPVARTEIAPGILASGRASGMVLGKPDGDSIAQEPLLLSVKVRGAGGYRSWQMLGSENSHLETVAQAALQSMALFGEVRDIVIATLNTAETVWDTETVPAERARRLADLAAEHLAKLTVHRDANGLDPDALPERDFGAESRQCQSCPFLKVCDPPRETEEDEDEDPEFISNSEAEAAVETYINGRNTENEGKAQKKKAAALLHAWMKQNGDKKVRIAGHSVSLSEP